MVLNERETRTLKKIKGNHVNSLDPFQLGNRKRNLSLSRINRESIYNAKHHFWQLAAMTAQYKLDHISQIACAIATIVTIAIIITITMTIQISITMQLLGSLLAYYSYNLNHSDIAKHKISNAILLCLDFRLAPLKNDNDC